jgi:hypothetical protein
MRELEPQNDQRGDDAVDERQPVIRTSTLGPQPVPPAPPHPQT